MFINLFNVSFASFIFRPLRPSKTSRDFNTHEDHQSSSSNSVSDVTSVDPGVEDQQLGDVNIEERNDNDEMHIEDRTDSPEDSSNDAAKEDNSDDAAEEDNDADTAEEDNDDDLAEEDKQKCWEMHLQNMELTKEMFNKNWEDHTFQTAFKSHVKRYRKAVTGNPNTFVSFLYTLQDKKMKNSRNIPISKVSEARRRWKAHGQGRTPAIMGRRNKDIPNKSEMLVDDTDHEGGVVYHTMPTSSSAKKRKLAHNLGKAVEENRQNAR